MKLAAAELIRTGTRNEHLLRSSAAPTGEQIRKLPRYIAITVIGTVLLSLIVFATSVFWITKTLDRQALENSVIQINTARTNLLSKARMITLDYTNWDGAVTAMRTNDAFWLYDNVGSAALIGQAVQLTDMWGGSLPAPAGWITNDTREPRTDALTPETRRLVEEKLSSFDTDRLNGVEFFGRRGADVFAFGAAPFSPVYGAVPVQPGYSDDGQLVMGVRLTEAVLAKVGENYFLSGIHITAYATGAQPSIPLLGIDGNPVAYIAWDLPHPGLDLLKSMTPILALAAILAFGLMVLGIKLTQNSAQHLIQSEKRASLAARTDFLTGLPNRAAFNEAITDPAMAGHRAIMFLDLNGFKSINDSAGHAAGDQIIVALAERLAGIADQKRFLSHISGDEFAFVINNADAQSVMNELVLDVLEVFGTSFSTMGRQIRLTAAIGYAVQSVNDLSGQDLMQQADLAMYEAKRNKANGPVAYCTKLENTSQDAFAIEQGLRATLICPDDLSISYQPIITADGRFARAEALVRWSPANIGSISPERFIPVAEQSGLMVDLGRIIFRRICEDLVSHPILMVNVNISPVQFLAPDFLDHLTEDLAEYDIAPNRIQLELTESILVTDPSRVEKIFSQLTNTGFSIALDDFGTGYSSISYLDRLTFNTLKLDRSFASGVRSSDKRIALIESMIKMAHKLRLQVVCEGVETAEDMQLLQDLNCDFVQGYYVDAPLPVHVLASKWLDPISKIRAASQDHAASKARAASKVRAA